MPHDPRFDTYIQDAAEFAQPILRHLRKTVLTACPDARETMKWSMPHFDYGPGILCSMAAFKHHCSFGFWLAPVMDDPHHILAADSQNRSGMGNLGKIRSMDDLPPQEILIEYILQAMQLIDSGVKLERPKPGQKPPVVVPDDLAEAMSTHPRAVIAFESFTESNKRDYVEWINEAKTEGTRQRRIASAIELMNEGKVRNWKYVK